MGHSNPNTTPSPVILFRHAFDWFLTGRFFSRLGDKLLLVALPLLVLKAGYSTGLLGLLAVVQYGANLVGGPVGGALIDRVNRRHLMAGIAWIQALAVAGVTVAIRLHNAFEVVLIGSIFLLHFAGTINRVNRFSMTALFAGRGAIAQANARIQIMESAARLVGPAIAGFLIARVSLNAALWLDAATFVIMFIVTVVFVPPTLFRPVSSTSRTFSWSSLQAILSLIRRDRHVSMFVAVDAAMSPVFAVIATFIVYDMHIAVGFTAEHIGIALGITAALSLIFAVMMARISRLIALRRRYFLMSALIACGVGLLVVSRATVALPFVGGYILFVLGMELFQQQYHTYLQTQTPEAAHGRLFAVSSSLSNFTSPVVVLAVGIASRIFGLSLVLVPLEALILFSLLLLASTRRAGPDTTAIETGHPPA